MTLARTAPIQAAVESMTLTAPFQTGRQTKEIPSHVKYEKETIRFHM